MRGRVKPLTWKEWTLVLNPPPRSPHSQQMFMLGYIPKSSEKQMKATCSGGSEKPSPDLHSYSRAANLCTFPLWRRSEGRLVSFFYLFVFVFCFLQRGKTEHLIEQFSIRLNAFNFVFNCVEFFYNKSLIISLSPRRKYCCGIEYLMLSKKLFSKIFSICTRTGAIIWNTISPLTNSYLVRQDIAHEENFHNVKFIVSPVKF